MGIGGLRGGDDEAVIVISHKREQRDIGLCHRPASLESHFFEQVALQSSIGPPGPWPAGYGHG